jgi:hypothetical protein
MLMEPKMLTGRPNVGAVRVSRQLLAGWRDVHNHREVSETAGTAEVVLNGIVRPFKSRRPSGNH